MSFTRGLSKQRTASLRRRLLPMTLRRRCGIGPGEKWASDSRCILTLHRRPSNWPRACDKPTIGSRCQNPPWALSWRSYRFTRIDKRAHRHYVRRRTQRADPIRAGSSGRSDGDCRQNPRAHRRNERSEIARGTNRTGNSVWPACACHVGLDWPSLGDTCGPNHGSTKPIAGCKSSDSTVEAVPDNGTLVPHDLDGSGSGCIVPSGLEWLAHDFASHRNIIGRFTLETPK